MYKIKTTVLDKIIIFALIISPVLTFNDLLLQQGISSFETPMIVKLLKDILVFVLIGFSIVFILKRQVVSFTQLNLLLVFSLCLVVHLFTYFNLYLYLSGVRWLLPFIVGVILIPFINLKMIYKISVVIGILFLFSLLIQVWQALTFGTYYGVERFSFISNRTSGFYAYPTSLGFFIIISFFITYFYGQGRIRTLVVYLTPIAIFLANSKTAFISYIIFWFIIKFYERKVYLFILFPIIISLLLTIIYVVNPVSITQSLAARINFFILNFSDIKLIGSFGQATSTFANLKNQNIPFIYADSFIASIPVNIGLIGSLILIGGYFYFLYISYAMRSKEFTLFLVLYGLFSQNISITEAFPMNLLFSVLFAYYINNYCLKRKQGNLKC